MKYSSVLVQKFGGSSVAEPDKIIAVAKFIKKSLEKNPRICVVISAMGKTTNNLLGLAHSISQNPDKRELDMLLTCGERISMALLSMALKDIGVKSVSLTGSQAGIITDDNHTNAKILSIHPHRVLSSFENHDVVIIAGFQGVSLAKKEITTLKRGGSDTTAVAMAAALKAESCEIYTDVNGVMSADPNIAQKAFVIPQISFQKMSSLSLFGAKVLAHDAAILAQEKGIKIRVLKTLGEHTGTKVEETFFSSISKQMQVLAITHVKGLAQVILHEDNYKLLDEISVYCPKKYSTNEILAYVPDVSSFHEAIKSKNVKNFALLCVHQAQSQTSSSVLILQRILALLKKIDINVTDFLLTREEVIVIVEERFLEQSLTVLHEQFIFFE